MSFSRQSRDSSTRPVARLVRSFQEERRTIVRGTLGTGTLACPRCDAPVSPGPSPLPPAQAIGCPFCDHVGAVRDFLSLRTPTRPARVIVRITRMP